MHTHTLIFRQPETMVIFSIDTQIKKSHGREKERERGRRKKGKKE